MTRRIWPVIFLFLLTILPAFGFPGGALPGKIAFESNRFPYKKIAPLENAGTTVYEQGQLHDRLYKFLNPRWSPDGTKLMGHLTDTPPKLIEVLDYKSGKREDFPTEHFTYMKAWFSGGRKIAYVAYGGWEGSHRIGPDNIYVYDLEQKKVIQQLTQFDDPNPEIAIESIDVSSDVTLLAFCRDLGGRNFPTISIVNLQTAEVKELAAKGQGVRFIRGTKKIVYAAPVSDPRVKPEGKTFAVLVRDLETGETRRITNDARYVGIKDPCPSPDGKWVCYVHHDLTGSDGRTIRVIQIDGTDEQILDRGGDYAKPDWGP